MEKIKFFKSEIGNLFKCKIDESIWYGIYIGDNKCLFNPYLNNRRSSNWNRSGFRFDDLIYRYRRKLSNNYSLNIIHLDTILISNYNLLYKFDIVDISEVNNYDYEKYLNKLSDILINYKISIRNHKINKLIY